ncbi:MAG TPA: hypothetical protein ENK24_07130, partial [Anaerolineae bacterium]|nr:hypothetical protein [Anaerolineae bacterium]
EAGALRVLVAVEAGLSSDIQVLTTELGRSGSGLELAGFTWDGTLVYADALEKEADVVLLSPNLPGYDAEVVQRLFHYPDRPILTIGIVSKAGDWAITMEKAGAVGHLYTPLDPSAVRRLEAMLPGKVRETLQYRASDKYIPQLSREAAAIIDRGGWQRTTVAFWSLVGGTGKTTLAANIAASLGVIAGKKTLLIDADMNKGDAHILFDMTHDQPRNIYSLAARYMGSVKNGRSGRSEMPLTMLKNHVTPYGNTQLSVLKGIPFTHMAASEYLGTYDTLDFMNALFDAAERLFDFVIVDVGQSYNQPVHLVALERAQLIYMLVNTTVNSLFHARQALRWTSKPNRGADEQFRIYIDRDRLRVVANKFHERHGISRKEISKALEGLPVFREIPMAEEEEAVIAANAREPLVLYDRRSPVSQGILGLGESLYPPLGDVRRLALDGDKREKRGLLARLLG